MFLFVVVSRQTKDEILCALCASAVHNLLSAIIGENLRLKLFVKVVLFNILFGESKIGDAR